MKIDKESRKNLMIIIAVVIALGAIFFAINFRGSSVSSSGNTVINDVKEYADNVSVIEGKQIILLKAKGGFSPIHSIAKAGLPTVLRVETDGTFDCSSVIRIPELNLGKNLPLSGVTDIDIGVSKVGLFDGTCGMGMYPFDIKFE